MTDLHQHTHFLLCKTHMLRGLPADGREPHAGGGGGPLRVGRTFPTPRPYDCLISWSSLRNTQEQTRRCCIERKFPLRHREGGIQLYIDMYCIYMYITFLIIIS